MMLRAGAKIINGLKNAFRKEDGSSTVEFVILFPTIFMFFLSSFEMSIYLTRLVLLERSLDQNIRVLRLGQFQPATHDELKRRVCDGALILEGCPNSIAIELTPISTASWSLPVEGFACVDRQQDVQPAVDFNVGGVNDLMLVRACASLKPFFGPTAWVLDLPSDTSHSEGGYVQLMAASTFVNEP